VQPGGNSNLGVLWPAASDTTNPTLAARFSQTTNLTAGQNATYRWVVTVPGFYKLQTQLESGTVSILNFANGQPTVLEAGTDRQLSNYLLYLDSGVYGLRFLNAASQPAVVHWTLKAEQLDWEKIIDNGVSQQSALSLMLFSPTLSDPNPGGDTTEHFQAIAGAVLLDSPGGQSGPLPTGLIVTFNTSLIGLPEPAAQNIAPIGPTVATGSVALADSSTGLHPGMPYASLPTSGQELGNGELATDTQPLATETVASRAEIRADSVGARPLQDAETKSARADEQALAQAEWLVRLGSRLGNWFLRSPAPGEIQTGTLAPLKARPVIADVALPDGRDLRRLSRPKRSISSAQVDIGAAASVIVVGTIAFRLRQPIQKWWRRANRTAPGRPAPTWPFGHGPHPATTRARATARARKIHAAR
jgi:hypothetical protein